MGEEVWRARDQRLRILPVSGDLLVEMLKTMTEGFTQGVMRGRQQVVSGLPPDTKLIRMHVRDPHSTNAGRMLELVLESSQFGIVAEGDEIPVIEELPVMRWVQEDEPAICSLLAMALKDVVAICDATAKVTPAKVTRVLDQADAAIKVYHEHVDGRKGDG